jgi:hypothetical protein
MGTELFTILSPILLLLLLSHRDDDLLFVLAETINRLQSTHTQQ